MCIVQTNFTSSSSSVNGIVIIIIIIIIIIIVNTWRDPPKTGSKINGSCAVAELSVKTYTPRLSADTDIFQIRSSSVSYLSYFSLHYQGCIDFNTVNIHRTVGLYVLIFSIHLHDLQRPNYALCSLLPRECIGKYCPRDRIS